MMEERILKALRDDSHTHYVKVTLEIDEERKLIFVHGTTHSFFKKSCVSEIVKRQAAKDGFSICNELKVSF